MEYLVGLEELRMTKSGAYANTIWWWLVISSPLLLLSAEEIENNSIIIHSALTTPKSRVAQIPLPWWSSSGARLLSASTISEIVVDS